MRWPFDHEDLKKTLKIKTDKELADKLGYRDAAYVRFVFKAGKYGIGQMKKHAHLLPGRIVIGKHRKTVTMQALGELLSNHSKTKIGEETGIIPQNFYGIQKRLIEGKNVRVHVIEKLCQYFKVSVKL